MIRDLYDAIYEASIVRQRGISWPLHCPRTHFKGKYVLLSFFCLFLRFLISIVMETGHEGVRYHMTERHVYAA